MYCILNNFNVLLSITLNIIMKLNGIIISLITLLLSTKFVPGQVFRNNGTCPKPPIQQQFDVKRFSSSKWYEIERYFSLFEMGVRCVEATFNQKPDQSIQISFTANDIITGFPWTINATGNIRNPEEPTKITIHFIPGTNFNLLNFWVLETDYDVYTVIWACNHLIRTRIEFAWILSRKPTLDEKVRDQIHERLKAAGISPNDFLKSNQDNCNYDQMPSTTQTNTT